MSSFIDLFKKSLKILLMIIAIGVLVGVLGFGYIDYKS
jgi:NhaP-type Na+/H+ and K+/H+ antiporter